MRSCSLRLLLRSAVEAARSAVVSASNDRLRCQRWSLHDGQLELSRYAWLALGRNEMEVCRHHWNFPSQALFAAHLRGLFLCSAPN